MMILRALVSAAATALVALTPLRAEEPTSPPPVVVELFTSQGCSSCPPADAYIAKLAKEPNILALGFHVDYWNYIGWTDPYSLKLAAQRQRDYGRRLGLHFVYTPQMVIDGAAEGVGSEPEKIAALLRAAAREQRAHPALAASRRADGGFHIHVGAGSGAAEPATVWLVGFDAAHQTKVLRGENEGTLANDYQVVRSFTAVGQWRGAPLDLDLPRDAASGESAAVLLQTSGVGPIVTATKISN
jgi:hypothetical protein